MAQQLPRFPTNNNRRGRPRLNNPNQNSNPYRPRDFQNPGDVPPFKPGPALLAQSTFPNDPLSAQAAFLKLNTMFPYNNPSIFPFPMGLDQRSTGPPMPNPLMYYPNALLANQFNPLLQPLQYAPPPPALNATPFLATSVQSLTGNPLTFQSANASSLQGPPLTSFLPKPFIPSAQTTQFAGFGDPNTAISATTAAHAQPVFPPFIPGGAAGMAAASAPSHFPQMASLTSYGNVPSFDAPLAEAILPTSAIVPRSSTSPTFATSPTIFSGSQSSTFESIVSQFAALDREPSFIQSDIPATNHLPPASRLSSESVPPVASDSLFSFGDFETGLSEVERADAQRVLHAAPSIQTAPPFESSGTSAPTRLVFRSSPTSTSLEETSSYPVFSNGDPLSRFPPAASLPSQPSQLVASSSVAIAAPPSRVSVPVATAAQSNADQQLSAPLTQAAPANVTVTSAPTNAAGAGTPSQTAVARPPPASVPKAQPMSWAALVSRNPTDAQAPVGRQTAAHIPARASEAPAALLPAAGAEGTASIATVSQTGSQSLASDPNLSRPVSSSAAVNGVCEGGESDKTPSPLDCNVLSPAPDKAGGGQSPKSRLASLIRSDAYLCQLRVDLTRLEAALEAHQTEALRADGVAGVYPRGLVNRGNWCFVNAVLQALLALPPFLYLMDSISVIPSLHAGISPAPQTFASAPPAQLEAQSEAAPAPASVSPAGVSYESSLALSRTIDALKHLVTCFQRVSPADVPERESTERHGGRGEKQPSRREVLIDAKLREAEQNAIDPTRLEVNLCEAIAELGIGTLRRSPTLTIADASASLAATRSSAKQRADDEVLFNVHQEDAEDLYSRLINALNEEMAQLLRPDAAGGDVGTSSAQSDPSSSASEHFSELTMSDGLLSTPSELNGPVATIADTDDGEWSQVVSAARNKSVIVRDVARQKVRTPVSELLLGELRSNLERVGAAKVIASPGSKQDSANVQPFCTLQLEIQSKTIYTLQDALRGFSNKESLSVEQVASSPGGIRKWQTLESLPPVLVFHLKCFVYDAPTVSVETAAARTGDASRKICKQLTIPESLELQREMIGPSLTSLLFGSASASGAHRESNPLAYSLCACVYHKGRRVSGGHYTTLLYSGALGVWLYVDDDVVQRVSDAQLAQLLVPAPRPVAGRPASGRAPKSPPSAEAVAQALRMDDTTMPYLLFYARNDCQAFRRAL